jgi:hypothetical protein
MTSITPVSGKWETKRTWNNDNRASEVVVTLSFNDKNGQYKISSHITTIQVSRNPAMRSALLKIKNEMEEEAMVYAMDLRDRWDDENPREGDDPDQLDMFDSEGNAVGIEADNNEHEPQLSLTAPNKGKKPMGKKAAEVDESDFPDDSTLSDDLPM